LPISSKLAALLNGKLTVTSWEGHGSIFTIILPLYYHEVSGPDDGEALARKLLVVDDDPQVADLVMQLLEAEGHVILNAVDGQAGLELAAEAQPDAVLLDLRMPGLDGFGVLERLQQNPALHHIPVIILTAAELGPEEADRLQRHVSQIIRKQGLDGDNLRRELERIWS
jgi:CheY-like chemotaxis protein